ncbi:MAG: hypothetical protein J6J33_03155 [Clostridia bacterium]|nr:hypothetical protein [Clostridia bacterium]
MISKKEFHAKYIKPSLESQKWDDKYRTLSKSNDIMAFIGHMQTATEFYFDDAYICAVIKNFTFSSVTEERKNSLAERLIKDGHIVSAEINDDSVQFVKPNGTNITFVPLTQIFPNLRYKKELESDERSGRCHQGSLNLSQFEFDFEHSVVTGDTYNLSNKSKYLHTWIETTLGGEEIVIDYTMNAAINKAAYYEFMHAKPINTISGENVKHDIPIVLTSKYGNTDNRMYLLFRDEMMAEIENKPSPMGK